MDTMVFINLPVADLGYSIDPDFTDETAACVVVSETISVTILIHAKFAESSSRIQLVSFAHNLSPERVPRGCPSQGSSPGESGAACRAR